MASLVSLQRVKLALRIDHTDDDDLLTDVYIPGASKAVINHLKDRAEEILDLDSGGELTSGSEVPEEVQVSVLMLVRYWYDPAELRQDFEGDELPAPVKALLKPLRDPALA